jgi:hypothetical protein
VSPDTAGTGSKLWHWVCDAGFADTEFKSYSIMVASTKISKESLSG